MLDIVQWGNSDEFCCWSTYVVTALLCGNLIETMCMWQPEGFIEKGKEVFICLLHKALYGLKQASASGDKISKVVLSVGFKKLLNGPCVFLRISRINF